MEKYEFASANGLAGGMELGVAQAGFELVHRTGSLDLGAPLVEANRKLYGWKWDSNFTADPQRFAQVDVPFVSSNPPCSGWSTLTSAAHRGEGARVMGCTDEVFEFVARQKRLPLLLAVESVQQAFSTGRAYYVRKRAELADRTGQRWDLVWLFHSNQSLGGASVRKRVFAVYARVPFGVEYAQPLRIARFGDAVRDLEGLQLTAQKQPYRRPATWWSGQLRSGDGVDGHFNDARKSEWYTDLMDRAAATGRPWTPGEGLQHVLERVWRATGSLPREWERSVAKLVAKGWDMGINQTGMWDPDREGHVVTGAGPMMSVHWSEHRLLTYREVLRLQGFPDTYRLWPARSYKKVGACAGKGVPVHAGHWLGRWVRAALDGEPGTVRGEDIGERERKIDITHAYKATAEYDAPWRYSKHTLHDQRAALELAR